MTMVCRDDSGGGSERGKKGFGRVACNEVAIKAVPVVEPHRLPHLPRLTPIQLNILKIALHSERLYQCLPEGGLQETLRLHRHREISKALLGKVPAFDSFIDGFLDRHRPSPSPFPLLILRPALQR